MGTHPTELSDSFPMNTNMTWFKKLCVLVLWMKVASALEGLRKIATDNLSLTKRLLIHYFRTSILRGDLPWPNG